MSHPLKTSAYLVFLSLGALACDSDYTLDNDTDPPLATPTASPTASLMTPPTYAPTVTPPEPTPEWGSWVASLRVEPPVADFGDMKFECPEEITLSVINDGTVPVKISNVRLTTDPQFSAMSSSDDLYELGPGDTGNIWLAATGESEGQEDIELWIMSPGDDLPAAKVPIYANVYNGMTQYVDSYIQEPSNQSDVLWVIDNSGSMGQEQKELANNFTTFMDSFVRLGIEYHMAVVTTDMYSPNDSGKMHGRFGLDGDKPYIDWNMREAGVDEFTETIEKLGDNGSGAEQGLDAMHAALSEPLTDTHNSGFLREGAFLSVIFISDENDQSTSLNDQGNYPFSYVDFLADIKKGKENVVSAAVLRYADSGGYVTFVQNLGGQVYPIGKPYGEVLSEIGWLSAGYKSSFSLSQVPAPTSDVIVEVNDEVIPPGAGTWSYDPTLEMVVFADEAIPVDGSKVEIIYWLPTPCDEEAPVEGESTPAEGP